MTVMKSHTLRQRENEVTTVEEMAHTGQNRFIGTDYKLSTLRIEDLEIREMLETVFR